jgi:hypothetical protein
MKQPFQNEYWDIIGILYREITAGFNVNTYETKCYSNICLKFSTIQLAAQ